MASGVVYYEKKDDDDEFIQVMEKEDGELIEFPKEDDGSVLLRTIQTQYATAIGLKYKGPTGAWRAVKEGDDAKLLPPKAGWGNTVYYLTFSQKEDDSRKRKAEETMGYSNDAKQVKPAALLRDLAVVGIPYEAEHKSLKSYFNDKYGGVVHLMIKVDKATGKSKGYGFIRFDNEESAQKALESEDDEFMGRKISVRPKTQKPLKMYVNGLPDGTTKEDIVEYFSKFGEIIDSHVPTPFKHYGFFTYASSEDGFACLDQEHMLKGRKINVKRRTEAGTQGGPPGGFGGNKFGGGFTGGFSGLSSGIGGGSSRGDGRGGGRGGFSAGGGAGGGERQVGVPQDPQMAAQLKNMLFQFLTQT